MPRRDARPGQTAGAYASRGKRDLLASGLDGTDRRPEGKGDIRRQSAKSVSTVCASHRFPAQLAHRRILRLPATRTPAGRRIHL
ncbi:hypothetical protein KCP70_08180 [Salmonella enterica subsp. enterica]|nr:hypothetical protein KCP70_08180 [Salmonella enterica subsp. enterica]